jgi:competence ComEA-like helix-hairpin-helix protein
MQLVLAALVPALFGVVAGVLLGTTEPGYQAISLLAAVGGLGAGLEHAGPRSGFRRGLAGGVCFGLAILATHGAFFDGHPKAHVPQPEVLLAVLTTAFGALLGALGGRLRARLEGPAPREAAAIEAAAARAEAAAAGGHASATNGRPAAVQPWEAIVDLNLATLEELLKLHPVGRDAAERIVAYRDAHGPFASVADLMHVEGFDPSRVARIAERALAGRVTA